MLGNRISAGRYLIVCMNMMGWDTFSMLYDTMTLLSTSHFKSASLAVECIGQETQQE